jgi:phosphoribosylformimino-5-aminoimidazole carboxamide ribonucleotide (ProFAR) isomerase
MGFDVLPAIDVQGGRLARLRQGDPSTLAYEPGDPLDAAAALVEAGARWIHVVDLDAALSGRPANADTLRRIAGLPVRVQAGGGLGADAVRAALDLGAARAVLGGGALADRVEAERLLAEYGAGIAVGLDVRGERLAPRGGHPERPLGPVLTWLAGVEPRPCAAVVTDVERDGMLAGVDASGLVGLSERLGIPVIASGGVRSLEDLRVLAAAGPEVIGAIVGRALHGGAFTLADALDAV